MINHLNIIITFKDLFFLTFDDKKTCEEMRCKSCLGTNETC